jgi:hypothetical protein
LKNFLSENPSKTGVFRDFFACQHFFTMHSSPVSSLIFSAQLFAAPSPSLEGGNAPKLNFLFLDITW